MSYPDMNLPFSLETDASDLGMGSVLTQGTKIIGFYSKKFTPAQTRYTVTEKELLAITESLSHFKNLVYLSPITVYTDHSNILFDTDPSSNRAQRWKLALEEYDLVLKYKPGAANIMADHLSRCFSHLFTPMAYPRLRTCGSEKH